MRPEGDESRPVEKQVKRNEVRIPIVEEEVVIRKVPRVKEEIIIRIERETVMEEREVEVRRERIEVVAEGDIDLEVPEELRPR